jgi:hypothetical protein
MDAVHEAEPAADEVAGDDEAGNTRRHGDNQGDQAHGVLKGWSRVSVRNTDFGCFIESPGGFPAGIHRQQHQFRSIR